MRAAAGAILGEQRPRPELDPSDRNNIPGVRRQLRGRGGAPHAGWVHRDFRL